MLLATATACSQPPPLPAAQGTQTGVAMDEMEMQVAQAAARANGWAEADVEVSPVTGGEAGSCRLLAVSSNNALPGITRIWAVIDGGRVVAPGDADGLEPVLDACGPDASAALWAEAIVAFGAAVPPGRVVHREENISSTAHKWAMADGGYSFHPPRFAVDAGGRRQVDFFMTDVEGNQLFQVSGLRDDGGPVEITVAPAGSR